MEILKKINKKDMVIFDIFLQYIIKSRRLVYNSFIRAIIFINAQYKQKSRKVVEKKSKIYKLADTKPVDSTN